MSAEHAEGCYAEWPLGCTGIICACPCHSPQPRDDHAYWAEVCTCGMSEQERTGHYPEHERWCEVPSPLDDDEGEADA